MLIAYDRDEAGDAAAVKLAQRLAAEGVDCFRVVFPAGQDANSLATSIDDPVGALAEVLRAASWMGEGWVARRSPVAAVRERDDVVAPQMRSAAAPAESEPRPEGSEEENVGGPPADAVVPEPLASPLPAGPAYRARRLKTGPLDDTELSDALDRAHQLHDNLAAIIARLEQRLDHQQAPRDLGP